MDILLWIHDADMLFFEICVGLLVVNGSVMRMDSLKEMK
jgi:hypothetical protein